MLKERVAKVKQGKFKGKLVIVYFYDQFTGQYSARLLENKSVSLGFKPRYLDFDDKIVKKLYG